MRSLSCVMLISSVTGSLADAGTVAAAMLVSQGVASPVLGRLADRLSQRRVLLTACLAHMVGMALLLVAILLEAPLWLLIVPAVATGCASVSFTSFMRARWAAIADRGALRTAYALESMLDETIFLLGPLLATALASAVHPAAGLIACAVLTLTGSIALALHRRSEPVPEPTPGRGPERAIAVPGVRVLMVSYAGMGFLLGAVDVTMIAFAQERSASGLAGVFLSLTAVGSLIAGAVYGAVNWRLSQARLLSITTSVLTLGVIPLAFADSLPVMGLLAVVAGVAISPGLIAGSTLLESLAPKGSLSEGFSWLTSAGALGIALGTAVGGRLADPGGFEQAAWAAVGGGILAMGLSLVGQPALLRTRSAPEAASGTTV
ncbi:MFS transporter [Streptomyces milbemycinicus]|uniref:MFS transporter n=1 Tax=Streptomyces milbemycinicus TaxID=476552 RepID=A0ABW8LNE6_9ACTN